MEKTISANEVLQLASLIPEIQNKDGEHICLKQLNFEQPVDDEYLKKCIKICISGILQTITPLCYVMLRFLKNNEFSKARIIIDQIKLLLPQVMEYLDVLLFKTDQSQELQTWLTNFVQTTVQLWYAYLNIVEAILLYFSGHYKDSYQICKTQLDKGLFLTEPSVHRDFVEYIKDRNIDYFKDNFTIYPFLNEESFYKAKYSENLCIGAIQSVQWLPDKYSISSISLNCDEKDITPTTTTSFHWGKCIIPQDSKDLNKITTVLTITTCKRYDLFEKTINSFLHCCLDLTQITYWLCVDDNSSEDDRKKMKKNYPWFNFIWKSEEDRGHYKSMNIIHDIVTKQLPNVEYVLHMEDDFLFVQKEYYIQKAIIILNENVQFGQVLFNKNYAEIEPYKQRIGGGVIKKTSPRNDQKCYYYAKHKYYKPGTEKYASFVSRFYNCGTNVYWKHFSFRPSLLRCSVLKNIGRFCNTIHFEQQYSHEYYAAGYTSTFFDTFSCIHIGKKTWERQGVNSYTLNNMNQFGSSEKIDEDNNSLDEKEKQIMLQENQITIYLLYDSLSSENQKRWKQFKATQMHKLPFKFHCVDLSELVMDIDVILQPIFVGNNYQYQRGILSPIYHHVNIWLEQQKSSATDLTLIIDTRAGVVLKDTFWRKLEKLCLTDFSLDINDLKLDLACLATQVTQKDGNESSNENVSSYVYIASRNGCKELLNLAREQHIPNNIASFFKQVLFNSEVSVKTALREKTLFRYFAEIVSTGKNDEALSGNFIKHIDLVTLSGYDFYSQMDSIGGDIKHLDGLSIQELKQQCDENPECVGFNTLGWMKKSIQPEQEWKYLPYSTKREQGLYIKKE